MEKLIPSPEFVTAYLDIPDVEIRAVYHMQEQMYRYILRRVRAAVRTMDSNDWRKILNTDKE